MHALPFEDGHFDLVVLMHALTYAARPQAAVTVRIARTRLAPLFLSLPVGLTQMVCDPAGDALLEGATADDVVGTLGFFAVVFVIVVLPVAACASPLTKGRTNAATAKADTAVAS